jgi:hypothetical protein
MALGAPEVEIVQPCGVLQDLTVVKGYVDADSRM